jgi:hypothetical protein
MELRLGGASALRVGGGGIAPSDRSRQRRAAGIDDGMTPSRQGKRSV